MDDVRGLFLGMPHGFYIHKFEGNESMLSWLFVFI